MKFSGNSLRMKRTHLLYHGTLLYDFSLESVARWLAMPSREPDYRAGRGHGAFLINAPVSRDRLVAALFEAWNAGPVLNAWPRDRTRAVAGEKYSRLA